jgi:hypothetical protein
VACDPSSSTSSPATGGDAGAFDPGAPATGDGGPSGGDAATNPDSAAPSGACPSGNPRPPQTVITAIDTLIGAWTVVPSDGPGQRTLGFGSAPGAPLSGGTPDWGCKYADDGGIDLFYDQDMVTAGGLCARAWYRLRFSNFGVPNSFGFVEGKRQELKPDGTNGSPSAINASWALEGILLNFDGQHFTRGAQFTCPDGLGR